MTSGPDRQPAAGHQGVGAHAARRDRFRDPVVLVSLAVLALLVAYLSWFRITDTDVPFHLASGREIVTLHHVPQTNTMGYTEPDARWGSHQWLGSVLIYLAYAAGGIRGLVGAKVLVVLAMVAFLVAFLARMRGARGWRFGDRAGDWAVALPIFTLAVWTARPRLVERPLLLSAMLEAALLWFLADYASKPPRRLLWLIPFFALWWNLHAGFIYGLVILGCVVLGDLLDPARRRAAARLALVTAASVAAGALVTRMVNPGGVSALFFPFEMFRSELFTRAIGEFRRSSLDSERAFAALLAVAVIAFAASWLRGVRPRPAHLLIVAVFGALAISRVRMVLDMAVVTAPIAAFYAAAAIRRPLPRWSPLAAACAVAIAAPVAASRDVSVRFGAGWDPRTDPDRACGFIAAKRLPDQVFAADMWSGWFLWRFHPERKAFIYNQLEVYREPFWRDVYLPLLGGDAAWEKTLGRYGVNTLLLRYSGDAYRQRIADVVFADPDWTLVYWDDVAMVYVRNTAAPAGVIEDHGFRAVNPEHPDIAGVVAAGGAAPAEEELRRVLREDPGCRRAWSFLGELCAETGRFAAADSAFQRLGELAQLPGERAASLAGRARVRWSEGKAEAADSLLTVALGIRKGDPYLLARRARIRLAGGDVEGAARDAAGTERARTASPADLVYLAEGFADAKRADVAERLYARAGDLAMTKGERARIEVRAAVGWETRGDVERAERAYRAAMGSDPSWVDPVNNLAWLLLDRGRRDEGLALAKRAVQMAPKDGYPWGTLGRGFTDAGMPDSAVVAYERAVAFLGGTADPMAQATTMIGLAGAYASVGRDDDARRYLAFAQERGLSGSLAAAAESVRARIGDTR